MTRYYLDTTDGNDLFDGLTYGTRVRTYARVAELMTTGDTLELVTTEPQPNTTIEELAALSEAYGPKRVKTPNMEVEQFDPITMQRLEDRKNTIYPTFGGFHMTIVSPDHCKYQDRRKTR